MKVFQHLFLASIALLAACTADQPPDGPSASPTPSPSVTIAPQEGLPTEVADVRAQILRAAEENDYGLLRSVLDPEVFLSDFGFGADEPDPIARWEESGEQPLRVMAVLLQMDFVEEDTNEGGLFRWPTYDAETKVLEEMHARDRDLFSSVMTNDEFEGLIPNEEYGYVGPRLGILADGTWWFLILEPGP